MSNIRYLASNELRIILNNFQVSSMEFAKYMDSVDPLKDFRKKFDYPKRKTLPVDTKGKVRREFINLCHNINRKCSFTIKINISNEFQVYQRKNWKRNVFTWPEILWAYDRNKQNTI